MAASKGFYQLVNKSGFLASNHNNSLIISQEMDVNFIVEISEIAMHSDGSHGLNRKGMCVILPGEWKHFKAVY